MSAVNYSTSQVVNAVRAMDTPSAILEDMGRRYPLLVARAGTEEGLLAIIESIPAHVSGRTINKGLRGDQIETTGEETEEEIEETVAEETAEEKKARLKKEKAAKAKAAKAKAAKEAAAAVEAEEDDEESDAPQAAKDMDKDELKAAMKELGVKSKKGWKKADVVKAVQAALDAADTGGEDDEWDI